MTEHLDMTKPTADDPRVARVKRDARGVVDFYDARDNLIATLYTNGYWCKWEYDARNNCIHEWESDGSLCKREYDAHNNLVHRWDSDGYEWWADGYGPEAVISQDDAKQAVAICRALAEMNEASELEDVATAACNLIARLDSAKHVTTCT